MKWGVVTFPGSNDDADVVHVASAILGDPTCRLWHKDTDLQGVEQLVSELAYTDITVTKEYHLSMWRFRYLWVVAVMLLGLEWILRRVAGLI